MIYVALWARAFAVTVAIETPVAAALLRGADASLARRVAAILLMNLASHPAVWFVFPELGLSRAWAIAISEAWAVAIEMLGYRLVFEELTWTRAFGVSAVANGVSLGVGMMLRSKGLV